DAVLAPERVHVRDELAGGRELAVDPAVARRRSTADRGRGDATLPGGDHGDARARVLAEHHHLELLTQEGDVVVEALLRACGAWQCDERRNDEGRGERAEGEGVDHEAPRSGDRVARSASTSPRSGIEDCAPSRVTESAAAALANGMASG